MDPFTAYNPDLSRLDEEKEEEFTGVDSSPQHTSRQATGPSPGDTPHPPEINLPAPTEKKDAQSMKDQSIYPLEKDESEEALATLRFACSTIC